MHQIELTDQVYSQVKRRAEKAGFSNVDDYIVDLLTDDAFENSENLDDLFTAERLAHIDGVIAGVQSGGVTYTMEEVREKATRNRADWMRKNGQ